MAANVELRGATPIGGASLLSAELEPFLRGETEDLPIGWKFQAFASGDEQVRAEGNQKKPEHNKHDADDTVVSGVSSNDPAGPISVGVQDRSLKRMVDPLTKPNEEAASRERSCGGNGESLQYSRAGEQEHNHAHDHKNLIPVIKRKFGQWIRIFHGQSVNGYNVK